MGPLLDYIQRRIPTGMAQALAQTGATGNLVFNSLAAHTIAVGAQGVTGTAGAGLVLQAGAGHGIGTGGNLNLIAGAGGSSGYGGGVNVLGGAAGGLVMNGGSVTIRGGARGTSGTHGSVVIGDDNTRRVTFGTWVDPTGCLMGFWSAVADPVQQPYSTGQTSGFTAGSGSAAKDDSTYTGGTGSRAYTVGDIVKHLKALGLLAS